MAHNDAIAVLFGERNKLVAEKEAYLFNINQQISGIETSIEVLSGKKVWEIQHEKDLAERQQQHLQNILGNKEGNWRPCMHDQCTSCHGTGIKHDGSMCVHCISCPCPKCTSSY